MSAIAIFSIPATKFPLGKLLEVRPGVQIRLESMIPTGDAVIPYFWVETPDIEAVEAALADSPLVEDAQLVDRIAEEALFGVTWSDDIDGVIETISETDCVILSGTGHGDRWSFRLRFSETDELSSFYQRVKEKDIPVTIEGGLRPRPIRGATRNAAHPGPSGGDQRRPPRGLLQRSTTDLPGRARRAIGHLRFRGVTAYPSGPLQAPRGRPHRRIASVRRRLRRMVPSGELRRRGRVSARSHAVNGSRTRPARRAIPISAPSDDRPPVRPSLVGARHGAIDRPVDVQAGARLPIGRLQFEPTYSSFRAFDSSNSSPMSRSTACTPRRSRWETAESETSKRSASSPRLILRGTSK